MTTDPTTAAVFGIPDAEHLESDLATAYETQVEPFRDAHDLSWAEIEEWSTRPPRSHLPDVDWLIETIADFTADNELDEDGADAFVAAGTLDDVRAAFQAALDLWASKITYRMADKLRRTWTITWDDNGQPLADGEPIYGPSRTTVGTTDPYGGHEIGEAVMNGFTITDADTGEHLAGPKPGDAAFETCTCEDVETGRGFEGCPVHNDAGETEQCPECGSEDASGCGAAWHDQAPAHHDTSGEDQ